MLRKHLRPKASPHFPRRNRFPRPPRAGVFGAGDSRFAGVNQSKICMPAGNAMKYRVLRTSVPGTFQHTPSSQRIERDKFTPLGASQQFLTHRPLRRLGWVAVDAAVERIALDGL